ncbi:GAP family protein [Microbacterium sp. M3]|uniref:GAP family protein n=1 Tax=Microbacterium arthrosphaerae TaxID=792652 RepID=A0ABU4H4Y8_9MICO|nr:MULTISPECIES: GAP family protein [Microbacterium]MDW4574412.1 GAP family protein [Microbacterium arthrosphaerae]MDW7608267.1 GAP family protein [Microbacterium sp. M3]
MELLADAPLAVTLGLLALLDGLSIGTLLIPVFLLLTPGRVRVGRVLLYLVTIAVFYLAVGILFMLGLVNLVDVAQDFLSSTGGQVVRLLVGAGLLIAAFFIGGGASAQAKAAAQAAASNPSSRSSLEDPGVSPWTGMPRPTVSGPAHVSAGSTPPSAAPPGASPTRPAPASSAPETRLTRWRNRLLAPEASGAAVMAVAIGAGLVEIATMLPYLVAMGMLAEAPLTMPVRIGALAAYCTVMVVPALVLLVLRVVAAPLVERPLARLAAWMERTGRENTAWIVGIVGFLIARGAATELGLFERLGATLG